MNLENTYKGFTIPGLSWYKDSVSRKNPHITVGIYSKEGGTLGEFNIIWDGIGIKLDAYDDSWSALCYMPELLQLMNNINENHLEPKLEEFADMLRELHYVDCTEYDAETNILVKAYIIPTEEYDAHDHNYPNPFIKVGLYDSDADDFVGHMEFSFVDNNIEFKTYSGSWDTMYKLNDDLCLLVQLVNSKTKTFDEFVKLLDSFGYSDRTNRPY